MVFAARRLTLVQRCNVRVMMLRHLQIRSLIAAAGAAALACGGLACGSDSNQVQHYNFAWDWTGIVGTGQSLSVGALGTPILADSQPYNNMKLDFGGATVAPPFDPTLSSLTLVPLKEPLRATATSYPSAYPANLYGETPHTAMADQITAMAMQQAMHD